MTVQFFEISRGMELNGAQWINGTGVPGTGSTDSTIVGVGSVYNDLATGDTYNKIMDGAGTDKWSLQASTSYVNSKVSGASWREPADLYITTTFADIAAAEAAINAGAIQGHTITAGSRLLITDITGEDANVYIVSGTVGTDATLSIDGNPISQSDTLYVNFGDLAGQQMTYNGTAWVKSDKTSLDELGFIRSFIGKGTSGSVPTAYVTNNFVVDGDNLAAAVSKLDTALGANVANGNYILAASKINANIAALDVALKSLSDSSSTNELAIIAEIDAIEAAVGLGTNGTFSALSASNYMASETTVIAALTALDAQVAADHLLDATKLDKVLGGTLTGNLVMAAGTHITINDAPVAGTDAVNWNTVQNVMSKQTYRKEADARDSVSTELPTGASVVIDGHTLVDGDRVLFTALTDGNNKVYAVGGVGTAVTFTAVKDLERADSAAVEGDTLVVLNGTNYALSAWIFNGTEFVQFNGGTQVLPGTGLSKVGNVLNVNLGAGIAQLPTDEVGIDLGTNSGLWLSEDGLVSSTGAAAKLAIQVDGNSLTIGANGIKVSAAYTNLIDQVASDLADEIARATDAEAAEVLARSTAITNLTNALNLYETNNDLALATEVQNRINGDQASTDAIALLQAEVDRIETATGIKADGTLDLYTSNFVISSTDSLTAAISKLDHALESSVTPSVVENVITSTTIDSVLVDAADAAMWLVTIAQTGTANKQTMEVIAQHNGTSTADATTADYSVFGKLKTGSAIVGLSVQVVVSGTGTSQVMALKVSSTNAVAVKAVRLKA